MLLPRFSLLFLAVSLLCPSLWGQRTVPIENEFVRVVSVVDQHAAKPGTVHEHQENRVMIYLDAGDINIRYSDPGRKNEDQRWKAGDIGWSPAGGLHTSQHVSEAPTRIVEIELRKPGSGGSIAGVPAAFAIDNPQVRVYRTATVPPAGWNYIAVDPRTAEVLWNRLPAGTGPFVITLLK